MSIQAEHYRNIDNELRKKHDYYVGQELPDGYSVFTLDQQIQRYSKTLAFWMSEREKSQITSSSFRPTAGAAMARMFFVSQQHHSFVDRIKMTFDPEICHQIYELAKGYKQVMDDLMTMTGSDGGHEDEGKEKDAVASEWLPTAYLRSIDASTKRVQK
jgi:hypothetical protein